MFPVSGAEQLNTSGAIGERPMTSQSGAYSRLVRPAPCSLSGRKRFQRPRSRARALSSSMIGGTCHRVGPASSYLSSQDPRVHFGLGAASRVDAIKITWPDGTREDFPALAADRDVVLRKGEGKP